MKERKILFFFAVVVIIISMIYVTRKIVIFVMTLKMEIEYWRNLRLL